MKNTKPSLKSKSNDHPLLSKITTGDIVHFNFNGLYHQGFVDIARISSFVAMSTANADQIISSPLEYKDSLFLRIIIEDSAKLFIPYDHVIKVVKPVRVLKSNDLNLFNIVGEHITEDVIKDPSCLNVRCLMDDILSYYVVGRRVSVKEISHLHSNSSTSIVGVVRNFIEPSQTDFIPVTPLVQGISAIYYVCNRFKLTKGYIGETQEHAVINIGTRIEGRRVFTGGFFKPEQHTIIEDRIKSLCDFMRGSIMEILVGLSSSITKNNKEIDFSVNKAIAVKVAKKLKSDLAHKYGFYKCSIESIRELSHYINYINWE